MKPTSVSPTIGPRDLLLLADYTPEELALKKPGAIRKAAERTRKKLGLSPVGSPRRGFRFDREQACVAINKMRKS